MAIGLDDEQGHDLLLDAMAAEHELYRGAATEFAAGERWQARALLAERKEEPDLAVVARSRAAGHLARARAYAEEYMQQRAHVARLKQTLQTRPAPGDGRGPSRGATISSDCGAAQPADAGTARHERDAILEAQLADLKRQLGRA
jgi:hypothetical protein